MGCYLLDSPARRNDTGGGGDDVCRIEFVVFAVWDGHWGSSDHFVDDAFAATLSGSDWPFRS